MSSFQIIDSGRLQAQKIMDKDAWLLDQLHETSSCILHLYEWERPSLTYGYFTKLAEHVDVRVLKDEGLDAAVRPTGGGIIFHLSDLAFSLLIPHGHPCLSTNILENYSYVNRKVAQIIDFYAKSSLTTFQKQDLSIRRSLFCMACPTVYDIIIDGRKIGGAAQRKTKKGLLHQASISISIPPLELLRKIIKDQGVVEEMQKKSYCLLGSDHTAQDLEKTRNELRSLLRDFL